MAGLQQLKRDIDSRYRLFRSILNFLSTEKFERAFEKANDVERSMIASLAHQCQIKNLRAYCRRIIYGNLDEMTFKELKDLAHNIGIPNFSYMGKAELLAQVIEHVDQNQTPS